MATGCWFLAFFWVWSLLLVLILAAEEQQGGDCSANSCGNLTISYPFWLPDMETTRSCGPLDFELSCIDSSVPVLRSSGFNGFTIMDISYEERSMHVVDVQIEEDLNVSKSCHFPRWNTSGKLAPPFKVNPANLNLIFYNCTKTMAHQGRALAEMRCVNTSNTFVRSGVRYDAIGDYADYALEGCDAIVMPVMGSFGEANRSDYERLISDGFLLTWDLPLPTPAPARKFTCQIIFKQCFVVSSIVKKSS